MVKKEIEGTQEDTNLPKKKLRGERQLLHLIGDACNKPSTSGTDHDPSQRAKSEVKRYMDEDSCEISPLV